MFSTDLYGLEQTHFPVGSGSYYDATCDALSVRDTDWPLGFPNIHNSCPRVMLREILEIAGDKRIRVFLCVAVDLMTDHTGREYWESFIEGDSRDRAIAPSPAKALQLLYEETAAGCVSSIRFQSPEHCLDWEALPLPALSSPG